MFFDYLLTIVSDYLDDKVYCDRSHCNNVKQIVMQTADITPFRFLPTQPTV